jgi:phosphatidate cytidylyltransferase
MSEVKEIKLDKIEIRLRVVSAVVLAPAFLFVVYLGGAAYAAMIAMMAATGLYEWLRLVDAEAPLPDRICMYGALVLALLLTAAGLSSLSILVMMMASVALYAHRSNVNPTPSFWFAMGLPYMAGGGIALIYLRMMPVAGFTITAYLLAVVWGMDIGAYFVGRLIGGPKLAPEISPNKTWSGFIGGTILAVILAAVILPKDDMRSFLAALVLAVFLAAAAQAGDLFKSYFKRRAGVKNSGDLIPGHGGVLDRIDGLVFAAMALAFLQAVFGAGLPW